MMIMIKHTNNIIELITVVHNPISTLGITNNLYSLGFLTKQLIIFVITNTINMINKVNI